MKKTIKLIICNYVFVIIFLLFITPALSFAYSLGDPLVPCTDGKACDFKALMTLINNAIHFVLYYMVIPIAAIMFAYAGLMMIISGDASSARTKAKSVFTNTFFGFIIAVAAFLIIRTVLSILGFEGSWLGFNPL